MGETWSDWGPVGLSEQPAVRMSMTAAPDRQRELWVPRQITDGLPSAGKARVLLLD